MNVPAGPFAAAHSVNLAQYLEKEKHVQRLRSRISVLDVALKRVARDSEVSGSV
jgi:hypothetical protein